MPIKLSKRTVDALAAGPLPSIGYDTELKGFGVRLGARASLSWFIEYRPGAGGRRVAKKRFYFGSREFTPEQARQTAKELLANVALGGDSKTGRKAIVLNAPALALLQRIERAGQYVIASGDPDRPKADLNRPWRTISKRAGLEGVRIHDLRHTHASVDSIEQGLLPLGIRNVIWLDGDATEPITSGHTDGYVLFTEPGKLLVEGIEPVDGLSSCSRQADIDLLKRSLDAQGRSFAVKTVLPPRQNYPRGVSRRTLAPCYLNAYLANGAVIAAQFGDTERDEAAVEALQQAFPTRRIRMLRIDHIASGGGGIHCVTREMPLAGHRQST